MEFKKLLIEIKENLIHYIYCLFEADIIVWIVYLLVANILYLLYI